MNDGLIFDHHAMRSLGSGNRVLSGLVVQAHRHPLFSIAVPAMCVAEAVRQRPGISAHLAQLPAVDFYSLDRITADACGLMAQSLWPDEGWPVVHAAVLALTTGWEIVTTRPEAYKGFGVPVMPVPES